MGLCVLDKEGIQGVWLLGKQQQSMLICSQPKELYGTHLSSCDASFVDFAVGHQRMGHMSCNKMRKIFDFHVSQHHIKDFICEICPQEEQHRLPVPTSVITTLGIFKLIHVDTWGPYHTKTPRGHRLFLAIIDDYSRVTWIHLMVTKDEVVSFLKSFVMMAKTQFGAIVQVIRSDNALELSKSYKILEFFASSRIKNHTSCVQTP